MFKAYCAKEGLDPLEVSFSFNGASFCARAALRCARACRAPTQTLAFEHFWSASSVDLMTATFVWLLIKWGAGGVVSVHAAMLFLRGE